MPRVSLSIAIPDEVYDLVIRPKKKSGTLPEFLRTLLIGYLNDEYIQSYTDGTLSSETEDEAEALQNVLNSLKEGLAGVARGVGEASFIAEGGAEAVADSVGGHSSGQGGDTGYQAEDSSRQFELILHKLDALLAVVVEGSPGGVGDESRSSKPSERYNSPSTPGTVVQQFVDDHSSSEDDDLDDIEGDTVSAEIVEPDGGEEQSFSLDSIVGNMVVSGL